MENEKQATMDITTDNPLAFRALYEEHHRSLYRYVLRYVKSPELTEDIVQDTFVKIWEKRESLVNVQHIRAFLFTVCRNQMLDLFKRTSREAALQSEITYYATLAHSDAEAVLMQHHYEAIAAEAIAKLPPQRQQIFRLCRVEGKSYEEVANELGISKSTVSDHLVKASRFLREYLSTSVDYSLLLFLLPDLFID